MAYSASVDNYFKSLLVSNCYIALEKSSEDSKGVGFDLGYGLSQQ